MVVKEVVVVVAVVRGRVPGTDVVVAMAVTPAVCPVQVVLLLVVVVVFIVCSSRGCFHRRHHSRCC